MKRFNFEQKFDEYTDYSANSETDQIQRVTFVDQPNSDYLTLLDGSEKPISRIEAIDLINS